MDSRGRFLGVEIGGTKLQLGVVGETDARLLELRRFDVITKNGAQGILDQIAASAGALIEQYDVQRIGIGFGGPIRNGHVVRSHQIEGWTEFPLRQWSEQQLGLPTVLANDCDAAALAEANLGAGRGKSCVFFVTVGTGVGGGLAIDGKLHGRSLLAVGEIGHLRPGVSALNAAETVEAMASGNGIARAARQAIQERRDGADELLRLCEGDSPTNARQIAAASEQGSQLAKAILQEAFETLGWAIAQVLTITGAERVVIGGGVSLIGDPLFSAVRQAARGYVFPPLVGGYDIVPAQLGEEVVVHGAALLAAQAQADES